MGETQNQPFQLSFNASLKVAFQGNRWKAKKLIPVILQSTHFSKPRSQCSGGREQFKQIAEYVCRYCAFIYHTLNDIAYNSFAIC
jgi:hypothetical protein